MPMKVLTAIEIQVCVVGAFLSGVMAPHWLLYWGHTKVRTCVIDGPISGDRGPSPSLSSCGPQTHRGILAVLGYLCQNIWASRTERAEKRTSELFGGCTPRWVQPQMHSLPPYLSLLTLRTSRHIFFTLSPKQHDVISLLSPRCLCLDHTVNPSIGSVLLLAHADAHLSMEEFILAANHSRGLVIKYRCANTLMSLMHCGEGSNLNQCWRFKYARKKIACSSKLK